MVFKNKTFAYKYFSNINIEYINSNAENGDEILIFEDIDRLDEEEFKIVCQFIYKLDEANRIVTLDFNNLNDNQIGVFNKLEFNTEPYPITLNFESLFGECEYLDKVLLNGLIKSLNSIPKYYINDPLRLLKKVKEQQRKIKAGEWFDNFLESYVTYKFKIYNEELADKYQEILLEITNTNKNGKQSLFELCGDKIFGLKNSYELAYAYVKSNNSLLKYPRYLNLPWVQNSLVDYKCKSIENIIEKCENIFGILRNENNKYSKNILYKYELLYLYYCINDCELKALKVSANYEFKYINLSTFKGLTKLVMEINEGIKVKYIDERLAHIRSMSKKEPFKTNLNNIKSYFEVNKEYCLGINCDRSLDETEIKGVYYGEFSLMSFKLNDGETNNNYYGKKINTSENKIEELLLKYVELLNNKDTYHYVDFIQRYVNDLSHIKLNNTIDSEYKIILENLQKSLNDGHNDFPRTRKENYEI